MRVFGRWRGKAWKRPAAVARSATTIREQLAKSSFLSLAMPANGRPLLKAMAEGGRGARRTAGVWFTDDDTVLRLAIREGDTVPGSRGGRIRILSVLERVADSAAQTRSFDENGDFVSRVNFDSGRQAIVKTDIP